MDIIPFIDHKFKHSFFYGWTCKTSWHNHTIIEIVKCWKSQHEVSPPLSYTHKEKERERDTHTRTHHYLYLSSDLLLSVFHSVCFVFHALLTSSYLLSFPFAKLVKTITLQSVHRYTKKHLLRFIFSILLFAFFKQKKVISHCTVCSLDICLYLTFLGQARQLIETCGSQNPPIEGKI